MEVWQLAHPRFGDLVVRIGSVPELREFDADFPAPEHADEDENDEIKPEAKSRIKRTMVGLWNRYSAGTGRAMLVTRNGEVRGRLEDMQSTRVPLLVSDYDPDDASKEEEKPASTGNRAVGPAPFIDIDVNFFGEPRSVFYRWPSKSETALFDVPAGSPAARRFAAMEASPIKRLAFPIIAGIGKVGWALIALLLAPIFKAVFAWLFSFLPDITIPWPQITIPWPDINIPWPEITIAWPTITLPAWAVWLLGHPKLWIPILVGIVAGIIAMRRARKSKETRQAWEAARRDAAQSEHSSPHQTRAYQDARPRDE